MVMFDWCVSGRAESVLDTVSNPLQEIGISALRPCEMVTCCRVTNSSFFWHRDAARANTTGSDSTQQTRPNTGGPFDWWERAAVLFSKWTHFTCELWLVSEMFQRPFKSFCLFIYATIFINSRRKAPDVNNSPDKMFHCWSRVYWGYIWMQCLNATPVNSVAKALFLDEKICYIKFEVRCVPLVLWWWWWWPVLLTPGVELLQKDNGFDLCTQSQPVKSLDIAVSSTFYTVDT